MRISKNIVLPDDAITQTYGYIGRKGSGKTYASSKMCELFLSKGVQCIVLDPVGNWYGLRLDKSGKKPSKFDIPIIGGEHGDIPLDHKSGEVVANFLLDSGSSAVIDVSHFRKGQRKEFVAMFAEQLFHAQKKRRIPLHIFIEEAQVFIPQRAAKGEERMLGAMEDIVRLGRNYGIGVSLNSQRPQSVNKEVLNQVEPLIVFQLVGSHERKAIQEWVSYAGLDIKEQLSTLPELANGDGFFWSPAWLRKFEPIRFLDKQSFDASATPTLAGKQFVPAELSKLTLSDLNEQMDSMVEKANEENPTVLKRRIKTLERKLNISNKGIPEHEVNSRITQAIKDDRGTRKVSSESNTQQETALKKIIDIANKAMVCAVPPNTSQRVNKAPTASAHIEQPINGSLNGPEQRILNSLAWWESTGIKSPYTRVQVAFMASYSPKGGAFSNPLSKLRSSGLINYGGNKTIFLTDEGRLKSHTIDSPATQKELHIAIQSRLNGPQNRILSPLLGCYPNEMSKDQLASESGYSIGGAFSNPLSSLKSLGLIEYPSPGYVCAKNELFL